MSKRVIVAIDGPAGAGKSTVARAIASRLDFIYIDTGAMYRAVALWALRAGVPDDDGLRLEQLAQQAEITFQAGSDSVFLNGEDVTREIRTPDVSAAASRVAAIPGVRRALVDKQRQLGAATSVVMEGRDIATVVFPDAQVKIFLDAPAEVRAGRRIAELNGGEKSDTAKVARDMVERDARDRGRVEAPLMQAPDAVYIDSARLSVDEVVDAVLKVVRARTTNGKEYSR
ncbi:MAG TPA: (d)CMP kinase [Bryobacteraceae bacterium]|nr:(d)CMP kinase [Bryobacteraceae bacterium]